MTELIQYDCPNCGGFLEAVDADTLQCPYCESVFETPSVQQKTESLQASFDQERINYVNNQRRNLYDAVCAKHISKTEVQRYATEIKKLLPDDFQANFYLDVISGDAKKINRLIRKINTDENYELLPPIIHFLIASLETEYLLELNLLIERAYKKRDLQLYSRFATELSEEAEKVSEGVYATVMTRDVFIAYSSKDMDKVSELCEALESQGFVCFVAARNLRHGVGSVENYDAALKEAMDNCNCFVFVSSANSRNFSCDAIKKEIPYIKAKDIKNAPAEFRSKNYRMIPHRYKLPRIEYRIGTANASDVAFRVTDEFFDGYEWTYTVEGVIDRLVQQLYDIQPESETVQTPDYPAPFSAPQNAPAIGAPRNANCQHQPFKIPGRAPTCTESGSTEGEICRLCGEMLKNIEPIPPKGHRFGDWQVTKPAGCIEDGERESVCFDCGARETEQIPARGKHFPGQWTTVTEATHENTGLKIKKCTVCGVTVEEEEIPAVGHVFGEWKTVKSPSCTEDGEQERFCPCGKRETQSIPSFGGHQPGEWETVKEAGHESDGLKIKKCIVCGATVEEEIIPRDARVAKAVKSIMTDFDMLSLPRDVFFSYSPKDIDKVSALCEALEAQGFSCFVASRDLRSGVGAAENYDEALRTAMDACACFVFVSSANSRSFACDALRKEIPYIRSEDVKNAPAEIRNNYGMIPSKYKKPRIEYRIDGGKASGANIIVTDFFEGYEWVYDIEGLIDCLVQQLLDVQPKLETAQTPDYPRPIPAQSSAPAISGSKNHSHGLAVGKSQDGITFEISGIGSCTEEYVVIPGTVDGIAVTAISSKAFANCTNLKGVTIPDSVTSIGDRAFCGCKSLARVEIPNSVTRIGRYAFDGCTSLVRLRYNGTKKQWKKFNLDKSLKKYSSIRTVECTDGDIKI